MTVASLCCCFLHAPLPSCEPRHPCTLVYRRHNDCSTKNFDANVANSLHSDNLRLSTIRKFARRTREYLRVYAGHVAESVTHAAVESLRRVFKCHRGSIDFDFAFIRNVDSECY